jgi:tetratricopeptide (TPR) repeat protein
MMKKTFALLTLILAGAWVAEAAPAQPYRLLTSVLAARAAAAPQAAAAAKKRQWKSTEEYNAFNAMAKETDPNKKIALGKAFLEKYANSDFAYLAHQAMMDSYQQLGDSAKAVGEAQDVLKDDPDNLAALRYLSFAFPYTYKPYNPSGQEVCVEVNGELKVVPTSEGAKYTGQANATVLSPEDCAAKREAKAQAELADAKETAQQGLDLVAKLEKPAQVPQEQFDAAVKALRSIFNGTLGFVALQQKDYAGAVSHLKESLQDNPKDMYANYRLGVAYLSQTPPDYNDGFWYVARAVALGRGSSSADESGIGKYLKGSYACYHGGLDGLDQIISQAANSETPPPGLQVAALAAPAATGNGQLDSFNKVTYPLKVEGCPSVVDQAWTQLKGQPLGLAGFVHAVTPGTDPGSFVVQISLDQSKVADSYQIELRDSSQPKVSDLAEGDGVRFQGNMASYSTTPTFVLTLDQGKINDDDLAAAAAKTKAKPHRRRGK